MPSPEKRPGGAPTPRPGTGGEASHPPSTYRSEQHGREAFARWFADWWLRRGHRLLADAGDH
jgi:hypothetical protein